MRAVTACALVVLPAVTPSFTWPLHGTSAALTPPIAPLSPPPHPAAALFGAGAALAVFYWRHKALLGERSDAVLRQLGITLAINMAYSLANRRIDNWCALGLVPCAERRGAECRSASVRVAGSTLLAAACAP